MKKKMSHLHTWGPIKPCDQTDVWSRFRYQFASSTNQRQTTGTSKYFHIVAWILEHLYSSYALKWHYPHRPGKLDGPDMIRKPDWEGSLGLTKINVTAHLRHKWWHRWGFCWRMWRWEWFCEPCLWISPHFKRWRHLYKSCSGLCCKES